MVIEINIGKQFSDYLVNRNKLQGDGTNHAIEFRQKFLTPLEDESWWNSKDSKIILVLLFLG